MTTYRAQDEFLLFHGIISSVFELVLKVRAPIFRADLGPEAAVSGGAPHVVLAVTLDRVLQQRDGGGLQSAQFCQDNTPQPEVGAYGQGSRPIRADSFTISSYLPHSSAIFNNSSLLKLPGYMK